MSNFDKVNTGVEQVNTGLGQEAKNASHIQPGKYRHYKGGEYQVTGIATHSETEELLVVYRPLYSNESLGEQNLWVRPLDMFTEFVIIDGHSVPRFEFVEDIQG